MTWYVVRYDSNFNPFVEEEQSDDHQFEPLESRIGESRFSDEMMQDHPALVEALEAWRNGDQRREAQGGRPAVGGCPGSPRPFPWAPP